MNNATTLPSASGLPPTDTLTSYLDGAVLSLILHADPVVQGVMLVLLGASVWCWAVILDKAVRLRSLRRAAAAFERSVAAGAAADKDTAQPPLTGALIAAAAREWHDDGGSAGAAGGIPESRAERRQRIDQAMRAVLGRALRQAERGMTVLATTGSAAPFIGLFGTVWGIMHSFNGIAQSQDTSLAVVAPGIAEALMATAMGLVAAIPAVIAYNKLLASFAALAYRFGGVIAALAGDLARRPAVPLARAGE